QSDLVAAPTFRAGVAQFQHHDLIAHDVELVAPRRTSRDHFQPATGQPPVRPPAQAGQPIEARFPTAITHYAVAPAVASDRGHVAQDRGGATHLTQLPQPVAQRDYDE